MFRPDGAHGRVRAGGSLVLRADPDAGARQPVPARGSSEKEPWLFRLAKRLLRAAPRRARCAPAGRPSWRRPGVFLASLALGPVPGRGVHPAAGRGAIAMQIWRLPSVSLEQSNAISTDGRAGRSREVPRGRDRRLADRPRRDRDRPDGRRDQRHLHHAQAAGESWRFDSKEELVEAIERGAGSRTCPERSSASRSRSSCACQELIAGVRSDVAVQHLRRRPRAC